MCKYDYNTKDKIFIGTKIYITKNFNNIFLPINIQKELIHQLNEFMNNKKNMRKFGIPYKLGYILYGVPGCGKSSSIYAISKYTNYNIYNISLNEYKSEKEINKMFHNIPQKSIVVIEDIDCCDVIKNREVLDKTKDELSKKDVSISYYKVNLNTLLKIFDRYDYLYNCIIIMTTNHIDQIDNALIRPGRIDHKIKFDYCDEDQINNIYKFYTNVDCSLNIITHLIENKITSAELINSYVLPYMDDIKKLNNKLLKR